MKEKRKLYSTPAKAGVLVVWLLCVAIFGGCFAFSTIGMNRIFVPALRGQTIYAESNSCAEYVMRQVYKLQEYVSLKNIFNPENKDSKDSWVDITMPRKIVTVDKEQPTAYSVAQLEKMLEKELPKKLNDMLETSYRIAGELENGDGVTKTTPDILSDDGYSSAFQFLYAQGSVLETELPMTGVKLADYAKENPSTVSLMTLYQQLVQILQLYQQYDSFRLESLENSNVKYYVVDKEKERVFTNMSADTWEEAVNYVENHCSLVFSYSRDNGYFKENQDIKSAVDESSDAMRNLRGNFSDNELVAEKEKVILAVESTFPVADEMQQNWIDYQSFRPLAEAMAWAMGISLLLGMLLFVVLNLQAGRRKQDTEVHLQGIDRIPVELTLVGGIAVTIFGAFGIILLGKFYNLEVNSYSFLGSNPLSSGALLALGIVVAGGTLIVGVVLFFYLSLVRRIKAHNLGNHSLLRAIVFKGKEIYEERNDVGKLLLAFGGVLLVKLIILSVCGVRMGGLFAYRINSLGVILEVAVDLFVLLLLLKIKKEQQQLKEGLKRLAGGELDYKISFEKMSADSREMAEEINRVGEGLEKAVKESMKSERLKADLITNVSHDIKTPLTSIINYVDLLKREDIQNEKAEGYIEILEKKSQRLKQLTEDLVEASKVSSGNITLEYTTLNLKELIQQTNGEFSERFAGKQLELVCTLSEEPLPIRADGRRIWRVIENLYVNVAKYAMPGTRVYVDAGLEQNQVVFTMKNISEQPLNIPAEELTERFIRGDVSRSTEGSGLGLSIARSLTEMQHGSFQIYLDGDLFKVSIAFPYEGKALEK